MSGPREGTSAGSEVPPEAGARRAVDRAARDSYGRLLAYLARRAHDIAAAEDALADAFRAALEAWPRTGVPENPESWLMTAARRRMIDSLRHARVEEEAIPTLRTLTEDAYDLARRAGGVPDERLTLLFMCAHPAIDRGARAPLMLQVVLGLDAARIASAFLMRPSAMGQRLTRTKARIREARLAFEMPGPEQLPARLDSVLEAVYAAYGRGWDDVAGVDPRRTGLAAEALDIGRLLSRLLPEEPEVLGLLALMLYCEARREARRSPTGAYVPLSEQDVARWSSAHIDEAERALATASRHGRLGHFQLEAAIQSVHAQRAVTGRTDWEAASLLYEGLVRIAPTVGAQVGRAAAIAEARGAAIGWAMLEAIPPNAVRSYQPYWALAAHLLERMQRRAEARSAYELAVGLCEDAAAREFLVRKMMP